jgi:hypothetical protein
MTSLAQALQSPVRPELDLAFTSIVDLGMNHVGLGCLDERSLMLLFGESHSRNLTRGLSHNANQILDAAGNTLYPAYFMTHMFLYYCDRVSAYARRRANSRDHFSATRLDCDAVPRPPRACCLPIHSVGPGENRQP